MQVINPNVAPGWTATLVHNGTRMSFRYQSVTRPTLDVEMIDVYYFGVKSKATISTKWLPVEFEVTQTDYDLVVANSPCTIEFNIGNAKIFMLGCHVRCDSVLHHILKIHTSEVKVI